MIILKNIFIFSTIAYNESIRRSIEIVKEWNTLDEKKKKNIVKEFTFCLVFCVIHECMGQRPQYIYNLTMDSISKKNNEYSLRPMISEKSINGRKLFNSIPITHKLYCLLIFYKEKIRPFVSQKETIFLILKHNNGNQLTTQYIRDSISFNVNKVNKEVNLNMAVLRHIYANIIQER